MAEFFLAAASALWLGVLTSISPCPLATNIAAISYIGRRVDSARQVFLAGLLYTAGRTLVYTILAALLVSVLASSKLATVAARSPVSSNGLVFPFPTRCKITPGFAAR